MFFQPDTSKPRADLAWDELDLPPGKPARRRGPNLIEILVATATVGVLIGLILPGSDWDRTHRFPAPRPTSANGFAAIAGNYYQGASRGRSWDLRLLPDGRYSFIWSGCTGVYERESGEVKRLGGSLLLSPVVQITPRFQRLFTSVKWGRRTYLVPTEDLEEFCDAILRADEPRNCYQGNYFVTGLEQPVTGLPELPASEMASLQRKLVIGTIVEVSGTGRARIDVGSTAGVSLESVLKVQGRDQGPPRRLRVVAVEERWCDAEEFDPDPPDPLRVGWNIVTAREPTSHP